MKFVGWRGMNTGEIQSPARVNKLVSKKKKKFGIQLGEIHLEGTVSQIFYLGLSLIFMKCRKLG